MNTDSAKVVLATFTAAIRQRFSADTQSRLLRLEVSKYDDLQAQLQCSGERTWIRWNNGAIEELEAGRDAKIPLSARLSDDNRDENLKVLNYRPGRRLVLLDTGGPKPLVIKGFKKRRLDKISNKYEVAHTVFTGQHVHTPEVVGINPELSCLAMVYEPGEPLPLSADAADSFDRIGESLAYFQDHMSNIALDTFSSQNEIEVIDGLAGRLTHTGLDLPHQWPMLRERLQSAERELPRAKIGLCHRDLYDKQFIQYRNHIALLDFDLMCRADVALDPANFLAHLVLRKLQGVRGATKNSVDICAGRFLQSLDRNDEPGFWQRLEFYQATTFCRLALVYSLRPPWVGLVPDLIAMGKRCLDNLLILQDC